MTEAELMQLLAAITPPDEAARAAAHALGKPCQTLGRTGCTGDDAGGCRRADRHGAV